MNAKETTRDYGILEGWDGKRDGRGYVIYRGSDLVEARRMMEAHNRDIRAARRMPGGRDKLEPWDLLVWDEEMVRWVRVEEEDGA